MNSNLRRKKKKKEKENGIAIYKFSEGTGFSNEFRWKCNSEYRKWLEAKLYLLFSIYVSKRKFEIQIGRNYIDIE